MDKEKVFVDGWFWKDPHEKAPNFVKGSISINAHKFRAFMEANVEHLSEKGWFTVDMKESKDGSIYFELNTWKPEKKPVEKSSMTSPGFDGEEPIDMANHPFNMPPEAL